MNGGTPLRFLIRSLVCLLLAAPLAVLAAQDSSLLDAARSGDLAAARAALARGVNLEERDPKGWTALMYASMRGYDELAALLLTAGADVNARASDGSTPLIGAAVMGQLGIARALLEHGADPRLENSAGATAQVKAKQYGHSEIALMLDAAMEAGVRPARPARPTAPPAREPTQTAVREPAPAPARPPAPEPTPAPALAANTQKPAPKPSAAPPEPPPRPDVEPEPELDPVDADFIVREGANIRSSPEGSAPKVGALPAGSVVRVLGKVRGRNWYRVGRWESKHYIWAELLDPATGKSVAEPEPRPESAEEDEPADAPPTTLPGSGAIEPAAAPAALLAQLNGRWTSWRNPSSCSRDFLEIEATAYSLTLRVYVGGEVTPLASQVPVQVMESSKLVAGNSDLTWRLEVDGNELRYAFGSGNEVLYFRCPDEKGSPQE